MVLVAARHVAPATCTPRDKQTRFFERNKDKRKTKQNCPGFEFKPYEVNDSSQSNQGTDHLVSHVPSHPTLSRLNMWSTWVRINGTTQFMYITKLKDGPKRVKKFFSMILESVFEMV
jgi:ribosome biogenesis protein Nip4